MSGTTWYRRGDGLEIEVRTGSPADKLLARNGAKRFDPDEAAAAAPAIATVTVTPEQGLRTLKVPQLLALAETLGVEVPKSASKAEVIAAILAEQQRFADEAAAAEQAAGEASGSGEGSQEGDSTPADDPDAAGSGEAGTPSGSGEG